MVMHTLRSKKPLDLKDAASRAEYETIMAVLQKVNFNKKKAAEVLNIDRKTFIIRSGIFKTRLRLKRKIIPLIV